MEGEKGGRNVPPQTAINGFRPSHCVFYLDLSGNPNLPKLIKYITALGGKCATFLDRTVTHLVTERTASITELFPKISQWNVTVWSQQQFASTMMAYIETRRRTVASPTLQRVATRKRDLSQLLDEERKNQKSIRGMVPVMNTSSISTAPTSNHADFRVFEGEYMLIEDAEGVNAPIHKEFAPHQSGRLSFPVLNWACPTNMCPFAPLVHLYVPSPPLPRRTIGRLTRSSKVGAAVAVTSANTTKAGVPGTLRASNTANAIPTVTENPAVTTTTTTITSQALKKPTVVEATQAVPVARPRPGYCEYCYEKYNDLDKHVRTAFHRQYALDPENFKLVDILLAKLERTLAPDYQIHRPFRTTGLESPRSVTSPSKSNDSHSTHSRNYTNNKRMKRALAMRTLNLDDTLSGCMDDEELTISRTTIGRENPMISGEINKEMTDDDVPSSPSFKILRRSLRLTRKPPLTSISRDLDF